MSELPQGWVAAEIGSLCSLENGRAFKPTEWGTKGLPIVRIQNLNKPHALYNYFDGEFADRYYLRGGELLFAWSGTPGTSFGAHVWRGGEAVLNQHIFRVDFNDRAIDKRFFRFAINQKLNELINIAHGGVGLRHVTKGKFESTEIPLAPLNEQKRIADKLDAVLARVDACRDRLDCIPAILKRFRQSVLAAATSGKLTEEWRAENGYSLDGWTTNLLGSLVQTSANGLSKRRGDVGNETVVLRLADFRNSERVQGNERTIKLDGKELGKYSLTTGDLLVVRVNGSRDLAGKFINYESRGGEAEAYCDHFIRLRLDRQLIAPQFALFVANSGAGRHYVESVLLTTAGQNTINQTALFGLNIELPSLPEQTEIVRRVEALFACADRLEVRYTAARAQVEKLTPAALAKAFRGELVPQDPNDEPASVLLARIHAQHNEPRAGKPSRSRREPG